MSDSTDKEMTASELLGELVKRANDLSLVSTDDLIAELQNRSIHVFAAAVVEPSGDDEENVRYWWADGDEMAALGLCHAGAKMIMSAIMGRQAMYDGAEITDDDETDEG